MYLLHNYYDNDIKSLMKLSIINKIEHLITDKLLKHSENIFL